MALNPSRDFKDVDLAKLAEDRPELEKATGELLETLRLKGQVYEFKIEPRCKICTDPSFRKTVNEMLSIGFGYQHILGVLAPVNDALEPSDRISVHTLRNHQKKHFPFDKAASAVYREITEQRAMDADIDFIGGTANALESVGFIEVLLMKAYGTLQKDIDIDPQVGLRAAKMLHDIQRDGEDNADVNAMRAQLNQIIEAVKAEAPPAVWQRIVSRITGKEAPVDAETVAQPEIEE